MISVRSHYKHFIAIHRSIFEKTKSLFLQICTKTCKSNLRLGEIRHYGACRPTSLVSKEVSSLCIMQFVFRILLILISYTFT